MQENETMNQLTFNDLPSAVLKVLVKVESLERTLMKMQKEGSRSIKGKADHTPMSMTEACEFLRIKRSNMYYQLRQRAIPAVKNGKNYTFFKDELMKWLESKRKIEVPMTAEEFNASLRTRKGKWTPPGLH